MCFSRLSYDCSLRALRRRQRLIRLPRCASHPWAFVHVQPVRGVPSGCGSRGLLQSIVFSREHIVRLRTANAARQSCRISQDIVRRSLAASGCQQEARIAAFPLAASVL